MTVSVHLNQSACSLSRYLNNDSRGMTTGSFFADLSLMIFLNAAARTHIVSAHELNLYNGLS